MGRLTAEQGSGQQKSIVKSSRILGEGPASYPMMVASIGANRTSPVGSTALTLGRFVSPRERMSSPFLVRPNYFGGFEMIT